MRLSLRLLAACSIALLAACSSGGYAFNGATTGNANNIQSIVFNTTGNSVGVFKLLSPPGFTYANSSVATPIQVTATAYTSGGTVAIIVPDTVYTWSVGYAFAPTTYQANASGTVAVCPAKPATPLPGLGTLGVVTPVGSANPPANPYDVLQLPTSVSGNGGAGTGVGLYSSGFSSYAQVSPNAATNTIYVGPVPGATPPYCLSVVATHTGDGKQGSQVIYVTSST